MDRHLHLVGEFERDRQAALDHLVPATDRLAVDVHEDLRGPYTGVDAVLWHILPEAYRRWPEFVDRFRMSLLETVPELSEIIGPPLPSLAASGTFEERTRFYSRQMVRCFSQGVVTMLRGYAELMRADGRSLPTLVFERADGAGSVGQVFLALFVRRVPASLWPAVVAGTGQVDDELATALVRYTDRIEAPATQPPSRPAREWAELYVESDGTTDEPSALAAYHALTEQQRRQLHDLRADIIDTGASWGARVAALTFHRERGNDDAGAGVRALLAAAQYCTGIGLSESVIELCGRGRALIGPDAPGDEYRKLSHLMIAALISTKRIEQAAALAHQLRRELTDPLVHMTTSYLIAMIFTRFTRPRDHESAVEWQNNAMVIARNLPDERQRLVLTGFQENGLALIEMHRGNLDRALDLVESAMSRLDAELQPSEWALHRSQLLYNHTRLLVAMGRKDEAYLAYATLIEMDPLYTDYLSERAKLARKRGDLAGAIAGYDQAELLGAPFPELFHNRGSAYAELGEYERAVVDFDFVLDMEPDDVESLLSRSEVLMALGRVPDASADIEFALQLSPEDPRLRCARGMVRLAEGALSDARADFDSVLAVDAGHPAALVNRAVVLHELGESAAAVLDLTAAMDELGEDPDLLLNRGIAHISAGRVDLALADFDRALQLPDADLAELQAQRALCLVQAS